MPARKEGPDALQVVGAAIVREGFCLVTQRGLQMSNPGKWEFPGGKIEPGESPKEALIREIREELGLEIEVKTLLGIGESISTEQRIHLRVYLAKPLSMEIRAIEHQCLAWLNPEQLRTLDWAEADIPILDPLIAHLSKVL